MRSVILVLVIGVLNHTRTFAADPPFAAPDSDAVLTVRVKAALAADRELAGLNLIVSVVNRVAVIGGPVPDRDLIERIEKAARNVKALQAVKVECWETPAADPLVKLVADQLKRTPIAPDPRPVGTVTSRRVTALSELLMEPVAPYPTIPPPAVPTAPVTEPRFAGLVVEMKSGTATITGRAPRASDAWDFAQIVRRRSDVSRVVIGTVVSR